jgi:hypothetical protein
VDGHAHRGCRRIKTHHKHADQPSGRAASLSPAAGRRYRRIQCREASAARANAKAAADSADSDTGP